MSEISTGEQERIALLNLLSVEGIGSNTVLRLMERFHSAQAVFSAREVELAAVPKMSAAVLARLRAVKADGDVGKLQFETAQKANVEIRTFWDEDYPPLLKQIESDAPVALFIRGKLTADARRLAVVGTRSATAYGKRMTREIILGLRGSGIHIVSGLASGT